MPGKSLIEDKGKILIRHAISVVPDFQMCLAFLLGIHPASHAYPAGFLVCILESIAEDLCKHEGKHLPVAYHFYGRNISLYVNSPFLCDGKELIQTLSDASLQIQPLELIIHMIRLKPCIVQDSVHIAADA